MTESKTWPPCDICGNSVSTREGLLVVSMTEINKAEEKEREWERTHQEDSAGIVEIGLGDALTYRSVPWRWGHAKCLQDVSFAYEIAAERFLTLGDALAWTLHLQEKRWITLTYWEAAVRRFHEVPQL